MSIDRTLPLRAAAAPIALGYLLLTAGLLAAALVLVPALETAERWRVPSVTASVPIGGRAAVLAAGDGAIWVAGGVDRTMSVPPGTGGVITRIDPASGEVVATIPLGGRPSDLAIGEGALWAVDAARGAVYRIDPLAREVAAAIVVGPGAERVVVGEGAVWVAHRTLRVTRIDPATNEVVARLDLGAAANWTDLAVGEGAVWLLNGQATDPTTAGSLARLDPSLNQVTRTIQVGHVAQGIAVGEGAVWVTNAEPRRPAGSLLRIDPATGAVLATVPIGKDPAAIAIGGGRVWVASPADQSVSWLDPRSGRVDVVPLGKTPRGLAFSGGSLWVACPDAGAVLRVE